MSIRGNSILWLHHADGEKEKESHSGKILIPARYENAPPAGFDACSCVILISRTRRRNARPFVSEIVQKGRRSDDVNCARPALATLHVPRSIQPLPPPARICLCRHFIASAQLTNCLVCAIRDLSREYTRMENNFSNPFLRSV